MNFLRNPIMVSVIAALAAALLVQRVVWPLVQRAGWLRHAPTAPVASAAAPSPTTSVSAVIAERKKAAAESGAAAKTNGRRMELAAVQGRADRWKEALRRDPFKVMAPTGESAGSATNGGAKQTNAYPPAAQLLHLKAVWRQSGSTLAVLNDQVIEEGEDILRFTVQAIEDNRVWVTGPNGRESVNFSMLPPTPAEPEKSEGTQPAAPAESPAVKP
jgi:hypothetical protein